MPDHTHILIGLKPGIAPSDLIGDIKTGSSNHINKQRWIGCQFSWQEGFGAFSVSHSHLDRVVEYIQDQAMLHRQKSFQQEYVRFRRRHHVPFDHRYILSRSNERGCTCRSYEALFLLHDGATNLALLAELLIGEAAYPLRL